jgi:anhydro-N-acetylmuramic acid kinase
MTRNGNSLKRLIDKKSRTIIGLNSGTSADGVDAAVIKVSGCGRQSRIDYLAGATYKFGLKLHDKILRYAEPDFVDGVRWLELDLELAGVFAKAAMKIIKKVGLKPANIDLIGSHGQTIRHLPNNATGPITYQLGDPTRIAIATGMTTVGDFRIADVAAGGQGAPLTPLVNAILFGEVSKPYAVLNIGGIANISVISGKGNAIEIAGADTGPGNMLIDFLMKQLYKAGYDKNGSIASLGTVHHSIIDSLLTGAYFKKPGVKSSGREDFGKVFAGKFLNRCRTRRLSNEDIIATATALTAAAAVSFISLNKLEFTTLLLTGGGAKNRTLVNSLKQSLPGVAIKPVSAYNYPVDYLEAISFAVLANEAICSNKYDLKNVTGSRKLTIAGKICPA